MSTNVFLELPLTLTGAPSGAAGGGLTGTYPNPAVTSSSSFTATQLYIGDGSTAAPSLSFTSDHTTGIHDGSGNLCLTTEGADALCIGKSTTPIGGFGNVGMGGLASLGDSFPLIISRSIDSAAVAVQVNNPSTAINSTAQFQLFANAGNDGMYQSVYSSTSTVDPYISSVVIRPTLNTVNLTLMGGETAGVVRIYTGGDFTSTGKTAIFNADHSTTHYGGVILNTAGSQPSAGASYRGMMFVVQGGVGVTDTLQVCLKAAAGTYSWVTITTGG